LEILIQPQQPREGPLGNRAFFYFDCPLSFPLKSKPPDPQPDILWEFLLWSAK
jgi:hypothetical protein